MRKSNLLIVTGLLVAFLALFAAPDRVAAQGEDPTAKFVEISTTYRTASNISDSTMPKVMKTAMVEQATRRTRAARSTALRALSSGAMRRRRHRKPAAPIATTATASQMRLSRSRPAW